MPIQTRSKQKDGTTGRSAKLKQRQESLFFSGALKRLQKSRMKKNRCKGEKVTASSHTSESTNSVSDEKPGTSGIRSSLFEKFKIPLLNSNHKKDASMFSTFDYNGAEPMDFTNLVKGERYDLDFEEEQPESSKENLHITVFTADVLRSVKKRVDDLIKKEHLISSTKAEKVSKVAPKEEKMFESVPKKSTGNDSVHKVKKIASEYLDSFLSTACEFHDQMVEAGMITSETSCSTDESSRPNYCFTSSDCNGVQRDSATCSFADTLFDEGFLSKPARASCVCPWPTSDRCLLSSRIETKNGNIYVVKEQAQSKYHNREILADIKKKKRSFMPGNQKFITPLEYHSRMMEHREHLERRQWQNIVQSQDYESFYHDKSLTKIPEYIYHNQTRHAVSTNAQLLGYMASQASQFSDNTWSVIELIAQDAPTPLKTLSPLEIDHFFYQFFFLSAAYLKGMSRSKKRKRSYLYHYFQPELYILPKYQVPRPNGSMFKYFCGSHPQRVENPIQNSQETMTTAIVSTASTTDTKEVVPTLPNLPRATANSPSKSPELRTVENVYSYKRKSSSSS